MSASARAALLLSALVGLVIAPAAAGAWGGLGHRTIATEYGAALPWPLDGLRSEDAWVVAHVSDADARKSSVPAERYRHYIDIDAYAEYHAGTLPHDRATLEAWYGAAQVEQWGTAPWAIAEVTDSLTAAMATGRWTLARTWIADLCHYVGDLHQPLHCTLNYDGQLTGNDGIHYRYETRMLDLNEAALVLAPGAATYLPDPRAAAFAIAGASESLKEAVTGADDAARAAAGGSISSGAYYAGLWTRTREMTLARLSAGAISTASFVYTAWANAGFPPVPNATTGVPAAPATGLALAAGPNPARDRIELVFALPVPATPVFTLVDARGRRIAALEAGPAAAGPGRRSWALAGALTVPGTYFVRMTAGAHAATTRVTVIP